MTPPLGPPLPPGRIVDLRGGRGSTFVRECPGPPGAPVLMLVHGLAVTADLNWYGVFGALGSEFRVIAADLRGHGDGPRAGFSLHIDSLADDLAALGASLGIEECIVVGYSLGGLVAQLAWKRHRDLVAGVVLCSTASTMHGPLLGWAQSLALSGFELAVRSNPAWYGLSASVVASRVLGTIEDRPLRRWARSECSRTGLPDVASVARAASELDSNGWIGSLDVPAAVIITAADHVVPPSRQFNLASDIPDCVTYAVEGGHGTCVTDPASYAPVLLSACRHVASSLRPDKGAGEPVTVGQILPMPSRPGCTAQHTRAG